MRRAVATRLRTRWLLVKSTFTPLIFLSGQSPSQDAKAEALRNRETSVSISTHCDIQLAGANVNASSIRAQDRQGVTSSLALVGHMLLR